MSGCLIPVGLGHLDGHVSAADGGAAIPGALVNAENGLGRSYPASSDVSGYYTRTLVVDAYTVTASAYGYLPITVSGVNIVTNTTTTLDFALQAAPTYTVSGTVTELGSGVPLAAELTFSDSPVVVWSDPATGFYQASLPQGAYTMQVRADGHVPQERSIILDQDQTQDFVRPSRPASCWWTATRGCTRCCEGTTPRRWAWWIQAADLWDIASQRIWCKICWATTRLCGLLELRALPPSPGITNRLWPPIWMMAAACCSPARITFTKWT
jgi:hypothetical protein